MSFIHVDGLSKTFKIPIKKSGLKASIKSFFKRDYKYVEAVKNVSFDIKKGEIVGYIGPNGAGKSTTIKMLCGILTPDSGTIKVGKFIPSKDRVNYTKDIGVVFGQRSQLWWDIPVSDSFELLKDIYEIEDDKYKKVKNELVSMLKIENVINMPVRQLSLGQRMRCEIAASLLHEPSILFLDEPTIGLDATSKIVVRNFIKKINKEKNVTIILTTHDMQDIETLTDRIILIGNGTILYDGSLKHIKKKYDTYKIVKIVSKDKLDINNNGIELINYSNDEYTYKINTNIITLSEFISNLNKYNIEDLDVDNQNIEDIIVKLYKEYNL